MSIVIVGIDPGDSTGVAVVTCGVSGTANVPKLLNAFQGKPTDALTLVELVLSRYRATADHTAVACERYVSMQTRGRGRSHQPTAQQVSGAAEHVARTHDARFVLQGPADAWPIASNDLLRRLGWYQTNLTVGQRDADDANMAIRHALLYLARSHASTFDQLLKSVGWLSS